MAEIEASGPLPETMSTGPSAPAKPTGIPDMPKQHGLCHKIVWRVINFVRTYFLPLALVTAILFGALVPWPGQFLAKTPLKFILVFLIFLLQGLGLNASEIKRALKACSVCPPAWYWITWPFLHVCRVSCVESSLSSE